MAGSGVLEDVRADDFLEYFLFPSDQDLENVLTELGPIVSAYTSSYIWHKDPFHLREKKGISNIDNEKQGSLPPHLYGVSHYGDNIEDEWFIVALLLHVSKEMPGLVIRVADTDGEFLLIEAADFLPSWAGPDTCTNRVYLYSGELHLVSDNENNEEAAEVAACVARVRNNQENTRASDAVQTAIQSRVEGYPAKARESLHHCNVYIPAAVAALLEEQPQLVAPAVLAFCDRDPIDMKACRAMRFFPPETRVLARVAFTRCLYASLVRQRFTPDRCTGWSLPAPTSPEFAAHELGAKLASGFEVLVARAKPREGEDSRAWQLYIEKLKSRGFFQGLLEGSQGHTSKMTEARQFFADHGPSAGEAVGEAVLSLLSHLEVDTEKLRERGTSLPPSDNDTWLEVTPQELDHLLNSRYGNTRKSFPGRSDAAHIPGQLNKFLEHVSGLEGAEFPGDESPPVRPKRGVKKGKSKFSGLGMEDDLSSSPANNGKINFNPESFSCAVQNILDFVIPDDNWDLESNSDMSSFEEEISSSTGIMGGNTDAKLQEYMKQMDQELAGTTMGQSFEKASSQPAEDSFDDIEDFRPVDINLTALRNVLASYQSELGVAPGPASSLLGPMGVHLETVNSENTNAGPSSARL